MISRRLLTAVRSFSIDNAKTLKHVGVDIKHNWNDNMNKLYWEQRGHYLTDLKMSDIPNWYKAFGDNFRVSTTFLKDSDKLLATQSALYHKPLSPNKQEFVYMGVFWIKEEFRVKPMMAIQYELAHSNGAGMIWSSSCLKSSLKFWKMTTKSDYTFFNYYISYYDIGDLKIPDDKYDNVIVKNARDVPDDDIVAYDRKIFQYERSKYILGQLRDDYGRVAYDKDGKVIGFGAVSTYPSGECCITPMYGDNKMVARAIFKSILEEMLVDGKKYWRMQVRSNDRCKDSYEWIEPFVQPGKENKKHLANLMFTKPPTTGIDLSKVFVNFHPALFPI